MRTERQARETALKYLYYCDVRDELFCDADVYQNFIAHFHLQVDKDFCQKLCLGTLKNLEKIDKVIEAYAANWKIHRMAKVDRTLLRVGTYELTNLTTPYKVVINEAVELAGRYGDTSSKAFINGILNGIAHAVTDRQRTDKH